MLFFSDSEKIFQLCLKKKKKKKKKKNIVVVVVGYVEKLKTMFFEDIWSKVFNIGMLKVCGKLLKSVENFLGVEKKVAD